MASTPKDDERQGELVEDDSDPRLFNDEEVTGSDEEAMGSDEESTGDGLRVVDVAG